MAHPGGGILADQGRRAKVNVMPATSPLLILSLPLLRLHPPAVVLVAPPPRPRHRQQHLLEALLNLHYCTKVIIPRGGAWGKDERRRHHRPSCGGGGQLWTARQVKGAGVGGETREEGERGACSMRSSHKPSRPRWGRAEAWPSTDCTDDLILQERRRGAITVQSSSGYLAVLLLPPPAAHS